MKVWDVGSRSYGIMQTQTLSLCLSATRVIWDTWELYQPMKPSSLLVSNIIHTLKREVVLMDHRFTIAENGLSFIETSALDATNVELSFQKILTGMMGEKKRGREKRSRRMRFFFSFSHTHTRNLPYRIQQGPWVFQQCHQTHRWSNDFGVTNTRRAKARWLLLKRLGLAWQLRINFTCVSAVYI